MSITGPLRAVGYARVSLEEQAREGLSLEDQRSKIEKYCSLVGLELVECFEDPGVSATKPLGTRPAGSRLLQRTSADATEIVGVRLDRLFRNSADCLTTIQTWDRSDRHLHLIDFGGSAVNTATAAGRLFITMLAGFAAFERDLIAERTASAMAYRRASRRPYSRDPFGWNRDGNLLVPVDSELAAIRYMRRRRAEGLGYQKIAAELNEQGIPPKRGRTWYGASVRSILLTSSRQEEDAAEH